MWPRYYSKFGAQKTVRDGITFASKREAKRYTDLLLLQLSGEITGLELQVPFVITVNGVKICKYIADFRYKTRKGKVVVEDSKGFRTPEYKLKAKLMKAVHGIDILET